MKRFSIAGGSVPGTDHTMPGRPGWKNNQDAFAWRFADDCLAAIVCDGCGDRPRSEYGAQFAAQVAVRACMRIFDPEVHRLWWHHDTVLNMFGQLETSLLNDVRDAALKLSGAELGSRAFVESVNDHFLFTMMGVIMTPLRTFVFSAGDGVYAVNGVTTVIEPFDKNAPPYLAYRLVPSSIDPALLGFKVRAQVFTELVSSIMIGSDGVSALVEAANKKLPGKDEPVGPISQFWTEDRFVNNPDMIRRRLALVNLETIDKSLGEPRIKVGLLPDDTTLVVIRPTKEETNA